MVGEQRGRGLHRAAQSRVVPNAAAEAAQYRERGLRLALGGQRGAHRDGGPHPVLRLLVQPERLGEPGDPGGLHGGELQRAEVAEGRGPAAARHRFVQCAAQVVHRVGGPARAHRSGRGVQQHLRGPLRADRRRLQQVSGHRLGPVAAAVPQPGRRPVGGLPGRAGPAVQHRPVQQAVGEARLSAHRVPAQDAQPLHRGDPAGHPGGVGPGHRGEQFPGVVAVLQLGQRPGHGRGPGPGAVEPPGDRGRVGARVEVGVAVRQRRRGRTGPGRRPQVVQQGPEQQRVARSGPHAAVHPGVADPVTAPGADQLLDGGPAQRGEGTGPHQRGRQGVGETGRGRRDVVLAALGRHQQHRQLVQPARDPGEPAP